MAAKQPFISQTNVGGKSIAWALTALVVALASYLA